MTGPLTPDLDAAAQFLKWIDPTATTWHLRTLLKGSPGLNYTGTLAELSQQLTADNLAGRGVFAVINEGGQTGADITRVRAVFADLDGSPIDPVRACVLSPHMIIESSPGRYHAYWMVDGLPLDQFKAVQRAIAARFSSDKAVCDLPRVMRLPGFIHAKGAPFITRIDHLAGHARYTAAQILAEFPAVSVEASATPQREPGVAVEPTTELLADLASALQAIPADERDTWVRMGAALRPLGDAGAELWNTWSATSDKHDPERDPGTWVTIGHDHTGHAAVFAEAQRNGWINPARARQAMEIFGQTHATAGPILRPVELSDVMTATVAPPSFIVTPLIPAGHLTLFGSHGGAGKSILALAITAHVAAGVPWAGHAVRQCAVLYVSLEDSGDIVRYRLRRVIDVYGLDAVMVARYLRILDGSGGLTALMTERVEFGVKRLEITATMHELKAAVDDSGLIVIDNASDAFDGQENERRQVRTFVRELASLGGPDTGVLLLAHIDKAAARYGSQGNSYSGSSAWHNSARSRLALVENKCGTLCLEQEKLNLGKSAPPIALCWSSDGVLIPDPVGTAADTTANADSVLAAINAAISDGENVPTSRTGPANTQIMLERYPDLPTEFRGVRGRAKFWGALTELQRSGKIIVEKFQNPARKTKERFAPVAPVAPVPVNGATPEP